VRRREFITLLGGAAVWPLAARGQQAAQIRRVGMLIGYTENDPETQARLIGWKEGRSVRIDSRAMRDRLKLFNVCMGSSIGSQRTMDAISTPPPHSIFHHGIRRRGGTTFWSTLPSMTAGSSGHTNSPHPSSREGHHSTVGWSSISSYRSQAAATFLVHRNSVPSTHMRCSNSSGAVILCLLRSNPAKLIC
jgi:hypothetical protein